MMSVTNPTSMITIAPLGDAELQDIGLDAVVPSASELMIKQEPVDTFTSCTTTTTKATTSLRFSNVSLPLLQNRNASSTGTITLSPITTSGSIHGIQSVVPVSTGLLRFTGPGITQTRSGVGKMVGTAARQPLFLIPAGSVNQKGMNLQQGAPIRLVPIQPKKTQAVVAPQAKHSSSVISLTPQVVPSNMSKGIISFSQENPEEFAIGRSEPMFTPKFGVSGMIFNSRTVTAGGQVKYNKDYLCNLCKHMSDSYQSFKSHFTSTHMFNCDYCSYKAFSRYEVVMHTKSTHPEALDDLRGYEMFEDVDSLPVPAATMTTTVLPSVTTVTVSAAKGPGGSIAGSTGLVTVPVVGMNGNKLIIQNITSKSTAVSTATTTSASGKGSSPNGYFTYKIVQPSKDEPKKYECDLCQYQTYNLKTMYEHASCHTMSDLTKSGQGSTTWECFYCNFKSFDQVKVVAHVSSAHPKQHIQLKRYTNTSVIKSQLSTTTTSSNPTGTSASTTTTSASLETSTTKLTSKPSAVVSPDVSKLEAGTEDNKTDGNSEEMSSKAEEESVQKTESPDKSKHKKSNRDIEEEDDGTAMWGCYYCQYEEQDRHHVVAHVKAEHTGRKIVITRRRLQVKDKGSDSSTEDKPPEASDKTPEEPLKPEQEQKDGTRKDYGSLIIKLKSKTKNDHKTLSLLRKELHERKSKQNTAGSDSNSAALPNLSRLMDNVETSTKNLVPNLSPDGTDLEMPILEPMVTQKNNRGRAHSPWKASSPKLGNKHRIRFPVGLKKEIKVKKKNHPSSPLKKQTTRVKSDLAFDQAEVVVLDHVPEDLKVDVSQLYVFNRSKQEAQCNICHRKYTGKMAYGHMREHLMIHTGERIWGCPYCVFRCNRRFTLYMHVKKVHPDMPIKLVRRRPYQVKQSENMLIQYNAGGKEADSLILSRRLRGPRSHREREMLELAGHAWECLYCSRKDVFKGAIKVHMKTVHPDKEWDAEPKKRDRPLNLLHKLITDNRLPMKEAKICLYRLESMKKYKVLKEILDENGRNLLMELDIDEPIIYIGDAQEVDEGDKVSADESSKEGPKPHNLSHAKYQCPYCSTRGVRPSTVKLHILSVHPDKELYIHDLRVSRRTQNQHYLYVCREKNCKFMTIMQQALYAHVAKNPTHVNPGLQNADKDDGKPKLDIAISPRVASLRRKDKVEAKSDANPEVAGVAEGTENPPDDSTPNSEQEKLQVKQKPQQKPPQQKQPQQPKQQQVQQQKQQQTEQPAPPQQQQQETQPVTASAASKTPPTHCSSPAPAPEQVIQKKKRLRQPLPNNHREGIVLNDTLLTCRYCDFAETTNVIMIKDHLLSEHSAQVPVAINRREKAKRKQARLHLCPMATCEYATYFEKAFSIHLKEAHSDVFFPFMQQLKDDTSDNEMDEANEGEMKSIIAEEEEEEEEEKVNSEENWGNNANKSNRKRRWSSSDDEPEWKPNNRNPRRKTPRTKRRSLASRLQPKPQPPPALIHPASITLTTPPAVAPTLIPISPHPRSLLKLQVSSQHPRSLLRTPLQLTATPLRPLDTLPKAPSTIPESKSMAENVQAQKKRRNVIPCNLATVKAPSPQNEAITEYPSAVGHIKTRFLCFQCNTAFNTLPEMKTHLLDKHEGKVNFCMDLYARYMRKKQSVFLCVQPECDFCCKTWATMRCHWTREHPGTITEEALKYFDKSIENSPAFRKRRRQNGLGEKRRADSPLQDDGDDVIIMKNEGDVPSVTRADEPSVIDEASQHSDAASDSRRHSRKGRPNKHPRIDQNSQGLDTSVQKDEEPSRGEGAPEQLASESADLGANEQSPDANMAKPPEDVQQTASPVKIVSSDSSDDDDDDDDDDENDDDDDDASQKNHATMDVMYQCLHCTYLSTDKDNIQMHLNKEHDTNKPEYTEIGAKFDQDGRVNMSVGGHENHAHSKPDSPEASSPDQSNACQSEDETDKNEGKESASENDNTANSSDSSTESPSVSKIKPLKLSVRDGEVTMVEGQEGKQDEQTEAVVDKDEKETKKDNEESDEESEEESEDDEDDDDDDDDDEDKSEESSSSSSDEESDDDDEEEEESSESGSSEESESSENESKASGNNSE